MLLNITNFALKKCKFISQIILKFQFKCFSPPFKNEHEKNYPSSKKKLVLETEKPNFRLNLNLHDFYSFFNLINISITFQLVSR